MSDGPDPAEPAAASDGIDPIELLNAIPGVVAVASASGEVVWINDAMSDVTGYTSDELLGSSMLDHLDLEWNPLSLESVTYAMDNPGMRLPTMLRFHTAHGKPVVMEVTANNQIDNPAIGGLVVHLRPSDERQLLDLILESFASGEDLPATMRRVHDVARSETLRSESAVVLRVPIGDGDTAVLSSSPAVELLSTMTGISTPWALAAISGGPVVLETVDELPPPLRDLAAANGFAACWAYPVGRAGTEPIDAVVVFWRREPGPPEPTARMMADRLVRLCELVLERVAHSRTLQHAATHDALTGLVNRAEFFDTIDRHVHAQAGPIGVLYLDLDGFKPVNDKLGHSSGDQVLVAVADRLQASVRPVDTAARLGGDEFAVACPGAHPPDLISLADRLLAVVRAPITIADEVVRVGTSIGISVSRSGSAAGDVLVAAADAALITAKSSAKGTWNLGRALD